MAVPNFIPFVIANCARAWRTPAPSRSLPPNFEADCAAGGIRLLPLTAAIVDSVARVFATAPATSYLRAADALHLASAADFGFTEIYSNDRHLLAAAPLFGLRGVNVIP